MQSSPHTDPVHKPSDPPKSGGAPHKKTRKPLFLLFALFLAALAIFAAQKTRNSKNAVAGAQSPKNDANLASIATWNARPQAARPFANRQALFSVLGSARARQEALDIHGSIANLYYFVDKGDAPLYAIDSEAFFELAWFFAPKDASEDDRRIAAQYAQKAYALSCGVLGKATAQTLFSDLLEAKAPEPLPKGVTRAKCEYGLCRVVFAKADFE